MNYHPTVSTFLVTGPHTVSMGNRGPAVLPHQALVFSSENGEPVHLPGRPSAFAARKFRYRYDVDISEHAVQWTEALPSGTGGFSFQATLEARWKVTDPRAVVKGNINTLTSGQGIVCVGVRDMLWPHTGKFPLEECGAAEGFLRSTFGGQPHTLPAGLTVLNLIIRLYLDQDAAAHLRELKKQKWGIELVAGESQKKRAEQRSEAELLAEREQSIIEAAKSEGGLLSYLIAQDPTRLRESMEEITKRHDVTVRQKSELLKDLVNAKLIQPAEAQEFYHSIHQPESLLTTGSGVGTGSTPQPSALPGAIIPPRPDAPPRPRPGRGALDSATQKGAAPSSPRSPDAPAASNANGTTRLDKRRGPQGPSDE
ncbi:hypothetical protein [Streptomyces noursei]|uniref:hypothetical protein n=1 Tax=Streptomyces noursei TaxID=1971 RepID=UPI0023B7FBFA|nr:hypothetical protein [Streptomyces noursei]